MAYDSFYLPTINFKYDKLKSINKYYSNFIKNKSIKPSNNEK